jgi:PEP-CTERM motif
VALPVHAETDFEIFSAGGGQLLLDNGVAPVPEPRTLMLLCAALLGLAVAAQRRRGSVT